MPKLPRTPRESSLEAELLRRIREKLPADVRRRYRELSRKLRAESITPREHKELLRLSDQVEQLGVQRLEALLALASLRGTTLRALARELGFKAPAYG